MNKNIIIIGSGFSSLSASCYLAKWGYDVSVYEKNDTIGGRAGQLAKNGFTFDLGPSWYWMPDIFDKFFADFEKKTSDYYDLQKLSPAYKIFFLDDTITIGDCMDEICLEFDRIELGSSIHLRKFISKAQKNYDIAINKVVLKPGLSPFELVTKDTVTKVDQFFKSISGEIRKKFKNPKLISTLEFPVLFLGQNLANTFILQFYELLPILVWAHGILKVGMYEIIKAMHNLGFKT